MNNGGVHLPEIWSRNNFMFVVNGTENKRQTIKRVCPLCQHSAKKHKRLKVYGKPYACQVAGCKCTTTGAMLK